MLYIVVGLLIMGLGAQGILDDWKSILNISTGGHSILLILVGLFAIGVGVASERYYPEKTILGELTSHFMDVKNDE